MGQTVAHGIKCRGAHTPRAWWFASAVGGGKKNKWVDWLKIDQVDHSSNGWIVVILEERGSVTQPSLC